MGLFTSLGVRNYRLFASGQVVSLTGTWMQRVAQDWLVLQLSHNSGTAIGITTGLQFLPALLIGLWGGVIADRYDKRRILMCTQAFMGFVALVLGVLDVTGLVTLWEVYVLALLLGVGSAIDTPTRQAFVSELVGQDQLRNAIGLNSATFNTARIFGPAVAGVLIGSVGTSWVFLANAVTFVAVIAGLAMIRQSELFLGKRAGRGPGQLRAGLAYVRQRPELMLPIILVGVVGMFGFNFQMTIALMAKSTFHRSATSYGLLSTVLAVGSLTGALLAARRENVRQRLLLISGLAFGAFEVIAGLMPSYLTFAAVLVPTGVFAITFSATANTTVQLGSSPVMRGRVMALYTLVFMGGTPVGAPLVGWIGEHFGARYTLVVGGTASALAALGIAVAYARVSRVRLVPHIRPRPHVQVVLREPVAGETRTEASIETYDKVSSA